MCLAHTIESEPVPAICAEEQAFADRLLAIGNNAMTGLMISVGHRTGLFVAMRDGESLTSEGLAVKAGLDERYVREWLGAMTTAHIIAIDRATGRYRLPAAHAAFLGRDAANGAMSSMFQFLAVLGGVETAIVDCFRNGGGVPYNAFERFHECMAEESEMTVVAGLEEHILPLIPGIVARLEAGIHVADIGCGIGRALNHLAALYPASRFTGFDFSADAIAVARREAAERGLANVRFEIADATALAGKAEFDLIFTFDAVHDQPHPAAMLANIRRLLKPEGVYLMQDIGGSSDVADNLDHPLGPWTYTISCMHCMTVSLAQGGIGLGAAWGEQLALTMLTDAGFRTVAKNRLPHDIQNVYFVCRAE
jgi:SAM-dependent methyltransferase